MMKCDARETSFSVSAFAPLTEMIDQLDDRKRERWERLWMVSDARVGRIHPLIYSHPITGLKVIEQPRSLLNNAALLSDVVLPPGDDGGLHLGLRHSRAEQVDGLG